MDALAVLMFGHGKVAAFFIVGVVATVGGFLLCLLFTAPFVAGGLMQPSIALSTAIGCGIGTGIVNAVYAAIVA